MGKMLSGKTPFSNNCHFASTDLVMMKSQGKQEIPQIFYFKKPSSLLFKMQKELYRRLCTLFLPNNFMDESGN